MKKKELPCPICSEPPVHTMGYLKNMSMAGKLARKLPNLIGSWLPSSAIRTRYIHGKKVVNVFGNHDWCYCGICLFGYTRPALTDEELNEYYDSDFWSVRTPDEVSVLMTANSNAERPTYQLGVMQSIGISQAERMLDFGAGMCGAEVVFSKADFYNDIFVLDKSSQTKTIASILELEYWSDFGGAEWDQSFDLVYSSHSLEHVPNLDHSVGEIQRILREKGIFFVEVPNIANLSVFKKMHHAPHTYCFSEQGLTKYMDAKGFDLLYSEQYGSLIADRFKKSEADIEVPESLICIFSKR